MRVDTAWRDRFRDDGFYGPIELMSPAEMRDRIATVDDVLRTPGPAPQPANIIGRLASLVATRGDSPVPYIECRHLDSAEVFQLATHPVLLDTARALYGADLLLWRTTFVEKAGGGPSFRWHQDWGGVFGQHEQCYGLEPPLSFTFWIALTDATEDNGCLRFVPGVRHVLPPVPADSGSSATLLVDEAQVPTQGVVSMFLRAGQCVVFTDRALHGSAENRTGSTRRGLAVRLTVPSVRVRPHFTGHACVLVSGRDTAKLNRLAIPPTRQPA